MPRIPVYSSRVQERTLPATSLQTGSPAIGADTFGANVAESKQFFASQIERVGNAGMSAINRATEEQNKYDNALARKKEMETADWARETYREETDTHKLGYAKDDGEGNSVYDRMNKHFESYYKEKTKGLTKNQIEYYQPGYDQARQAYMAKADAYVAQQVDEFNKSEKASQINHRIDSATEFREDPDKLAQIQFDNEADLRSLFPGAPKAFIDEKIKNGNDLIHSAIVASYLREGNPDSTTKGWRYFKENASQMEEKVKGDLQVQLEKASLNDMATLKADQLEIEYDYQEGVEKAKSLTAENVNDEDLRDATVKLLKSREVARKQLQKQVEDQNFNNAYDFILDVQGDTREAKYVASEKYINDNFRGKDRDTLLSRAKSLHRGAGTQETNLEDYQELASMQMGNKAEFLKINIIRKYGDKLSDGDLKRFINTQEEMKAGRESYSLEGRITDSAKEIGAGVDTKKPESYKKFRDYKDAIELRVKGIKQSTGKEPTLDDINKIIRDEQVNYKLKGIEGGEVENSRFWSFGYGVDVEVQKSLEDPTGLPDVEDEKLREELTADIEKDGRFIANDTTIRIYARLKMGGAYTPEIQALANKYRK
jgi:hypothetical protein